MSEFQSTLPGWGATANNSRRITQVTHFNPRSPDGERRRCGQSLSISFIFQSTLPGWGATLNRRQTRKHFGSISIHAPRMGSDPTHCPISRSRRYFNPRSPDGERREFRCGVAHAGRISIHAPRMGSDTSRPARRPCGRDFNPRSPDGERRRMELTKRRRTSYFNPRSPDGERLQSDFQTRPNTYFNPRSPDGERQFVVSNISSHWKFQSTLPGWGATPPLAPSAQVFLVFQSTLPGWGATGARAAHTPETS